MKYLLWERSLKFNKRILSYFSTSSFFGILYTLSRRCTNDAENYEPRVNDLVSHDV